MDCLSGGVTTRGMTIGVVIDAWIGTVVSAPVCPVGLDLELSRAELWARADNRGERRTRAADVRLGLLRGVPEPLPPLRGTSQTVVSEVSDDPKSSRFAGLSGPCNSAWK